MTIASGQSLILRTLIASLVVGIGYSIAVSLFVIESPLSLYDLNRSDFLVAPGMAMLAVGIPLALFRTCQLLGHPPIESLGLGDAARDAVLEIIFYTSWYLLGVYWFLWVLDLNG